MLSLSLSHRPGLPAHSGEEADLSLPLTRALPVSRARLYFLSRSRDLADFFLFLTHTRRQSGKRSHKPRRSVGAGAHHHVCNCLCESGREIGGLGEQRVATKEEEEGGKECDRLCVRTCSSVCECVPVCASACVCEHTSAGMSAVISSTLFQRLPVLLFLCFTLASQPCFPFHYVHTCTETRLLLHSSIACCLALPALTRWITSA